MSASLQESVAAAVRREVEKKGLTQDQLGELLGEGQWWVSRRLTGNVQITAADIIRFARVLEIPVAELMPEEETAA
jgi:transcriptional regulator with XRE-family HTH domain